MILSIHPIRGKIVKMFSGTIVCKDKNIGKFILFKECSNFCVNNNSDALFQRRRSHARLIHVKGNVAQPHDS